jgi:FMN phosphatase YigB (HAD superfamily)
MTKFPSIFSIFEGTSIPFNSSQAMMVKKPHPDFFTTHLHKYNLKPENIIFIDDKIINVKSAQSVGLYAIQFNNAAQLRDELVKRAILKRA